MSKTVTASEARNNFFAILHEVETPGVSIVITYEGHPKGVLMSIDEFESWMETMEIMADPDVTMRQDILGGIAEMKSGKRPKDTVNLDILKKKLKL